MSEEISFDQELRKLLRREPFVPFSLALTSGDSHDIVDPQSMALGATTIMIFLPSHKKIPPVMAKTNQIKFNLLNTPRIMTPYNNIHCHKNGDSTP